MSMILYAPAKINLGLVVCGKLSNGLHKIYTIYNQTSLYDDIYLDTLTDNIVKIVCDDKKISQKENFAYKAAMLLKQNYSIRFGVLIKITKRIPVGSGLGGGSSDAASVLLGLNQLWGINISTNELVRLGRQVSSDVSYHILGGTMFEVQGDDDLHRFKKLTSLPKMQVVICFPEIIISSKDAYGWIKEGNSEKNQLQELQMAINKSDINRIGRNLYNDFEQLTFRKYPIISTIKKILLEQKAISALLSGKGSSVYGLYTDKKLAQKAYLTLKNRFPKTFLVKTL